MGEISLDAGKEMTPRLQVCICTIGQDGINRIAEKDYPRVDGVEHLVILQDPDGNVAIPPMLERRSDFRIITSESRGIARNRNNALDHATAPVAMITDDDVSYIADDYLTVIKAFDENPEAAAISFRYRSSDYPKSYPDRSLRWGKRAEGYHLTAFELAVRPGAIADKIRFNEHFGFATDFLGGEDDVFYFEAVRKGLDCRFIPVDIGRHDHATTSVTARKDIHLIETKGAIVSYVSPLIWPLRMIAHALREAGSGHPFTRRDYLRAWLRGIKKARRLRVFGQ